ncbi:hypothetical protein OYT1_ch0180 [Ferriphaselus amnicola]|uniref:Uncharacterized protein n=1 Tax=Ferriphaselus amnicola TaxID=1188319 RepID=A0A2Z6G8N1_9PROT|nr:hypothetical protein OYT1_ch0180 [Ferriphaselus amnicola]
MVYPAEIYPSSTLGWLLPMAIEGAAQTIAYGKVLHSLATKALRPKACLSHSALPQACSASLLAPVKQIDLS